LWPTRAAGLGGPAAYRVIAAADALDRRIELDETNDTATSGPMTVAP
jgi:hypothetical protein